MLSPYHIDDHFYKLGGINRNFYQLVVYYLCEIIINDNDWVIAIVFLVFWY